MDAVATQPPDHVRSAESADDPSAGSATTDVLIVGAGPYGIALAYELHLQGIDFRIVGEPFSLWQRHTLSATTLRSDINASQIFARDNQFSLRKYISGAHPPDEAAQIMRGRIPVEVFRAYANWILAQLPFRPLERKVTLLRQVGAEDEASFVATLDDGSQIKARRVVLASGIESHQVLPECLASLPSRLVMHSWRVREFENLTGKRLLVVGGGQSAGEILAHLYLQNEVAWVYRSRLIFFAEPINLPRPVFALVLRLSVAYYFLPRPLRKLLGKLFVASTITPNLKPTLMDGHFLRLQADAASLGLVEREGAVYSSKLDRSFDHVIACTGYRYSLSSMGFLDSALAAKINTGPDGTPRLGYDFASSVPGLFMVGGIAESVHGPALRFMIGGRHATLRVAQALCKSRPKTARP